MAEKKTKEEQRKKSEQLHSLRVQKIKELYEFTDDQYQNEYYPDYYLNPNREYIATKMTSIIKPPSTYENLLKELDTMYGGDTYIDTLDALNDSDTIFTEYMKTLHQLELVINFLGEDIPFTKGTILY